MYGENDGLGHIGEGLPDSSGHVFITAAVLAVSTARRANIRIDIADGGAGAV